VREFGTRHRVVEIEPPEPGPGRVRITTAGEHGRSRRPDVLVALDPWPRPQSPCTLRRGLELAGTIESLGPGVTGWSVGTRVAAISRFAPGARGARAELVAVECGSPIRLPAGSSFAEGATVPMNGLTALRAIDALELSAGSVPAVRGAAGALGGYLIELGRAFGLRVLAIGRPSDVELMARLGAEWAIGGGDDVVGRVRLLVPGGADGLVDTALMGCGRPRRDP